MSVRVFCFFWMVLGGCWVPMLQAAELPKATLAKKPFWEKKDKVYQRMLEHRAIFVSVTTRKDKPLNHLSILGAGVVSRPRPLVVQTLKRYSDWSSIHGSIKESKWTPSNNRLFLHMEAFKYHAKMILHVREEHREGEDWVYMNVIQGSFKGMQVAFRLKDAKSRKTEVALVAGYRYRELPMPLFFIEFGLEVVFQKIAEKMRQFVENDNIEVKD